MSSKKKQNAVTRGNLNTTTTTRALEMALQWLEVQGDSDPAHLFLLAARTDVNSDIRELKICYVTRSSYSPNKYLESVINLLSHFLQCRPYFDGDGIHNLGTAQPIFK